MHRFISIVEKTAGYLLGIVAALTFAEAALRYVFNSHIPDGFVVGQLMQGVAICWGIATATYADRHITVDILYAAGPRWLRRTFDIFGYTLNLLFMTAFGAGITYKVYDIYHAGQISSELLIPLWYGYTLASFGIVAAVVLAFFRWWQVVFLNQSGSANHG
jgi:TRAP-type C4-dicarboxylate transport system permease small subunit